MMGFPWRRHQTGFPFRLKLKLLSVATVAFALALSCIGLLALQYHNDRQASERRHQQISEVISTNLGAAILFGDQSAARESLASVRGISDIVWARAYDAHGDLLSQFPARDSALPGGAAPAWVALSPARRGLVTSETELRQPIMIDGERVGELRLGVRFRTLGSILQETALSAFVMFAVCLIFALFVASVLGRMVLRPIERLSTAMVEVGDSGDFSVSLPRDEDPDFNVIVDSFNAMLDEINARNAELSATAQDLRHARDEAEEANRAKSQFLANMSHELRTPLNAIIGYTEVLQEELATAGMERSLEDVQWIYSSARQLLGLINGILDLSKIEAGRMDVDIHAFDVNKLLQEVSAMLEPLAGQKGNRLHLQIDPTIGVAHTDSTKLRQCLLNLGSNACKFTDNGHVVIVARTEGQMLVFEVSDTGIGMSPDELDRLFQPFVQADASTTRRYGGTGLGLAITWRFAEMLGGGVDVMSAPCEGATFTLRIRADGRPDHVVPDDAPADEEDEPVAMRDRATGRPLALIVEDEPSSVQLLMRLVEQAGYDAVVAGDGEKGLDRARLHRPDLILLDIGLPGMNGWQVLDVLEGDDRLQSIPTVVVSVDDDRRRSLGSGACDHLVKPINRRELVDILGLYAGRQDGLVLIVEDDEAMARLLERGVSQLGFATRVVGDGRAALEVLGKENVNLLLTDLRLPHLDGFALVDAVAAMPADRRPPVMVVTAKILNADEQGQLDGKVAQLLPKSGLSPRKLASNIIDLVPRCQPLATAITGDVA
jgi:signal transduction histidine kinase/CheY-like chemotaxis protein